MNLAPSGVLQRSGGTTEARMELAVVTVDMTWLPQPMDCATPDPRRMRQYVQLRPDRPETAGRESRAGRRSIRWTTDRESCIEIAPVEMLIETESLFACDCPPPSSPKEASVHIDLVVNAYMQHGTPQECKVL